MRALYTPAPGEYGLVELPLPEIGVNDALVKVTHAGLCHTDVIIRAGLAGHVTYPVIPGHEFSGIVEKCGSAVDNVKPGDRVVVHHVMACGICSSCRAGDTMGCENYNELGSKSNGGFAEYCSVPARHLHKLADHVTSEEGALIEPVSNAISAVKRCDIKCGDRVVIIGPGPIGLLAVQVAKLANPSMLILVGTRDERLALGSKLGATHTVNVKQEGSVESLKSILGPRGANAVIECAGTKSSLDLAMDIVGWRGRIAVEGVFDKEDMASVSPYSLFLCRAVGLLGVNGWTTADFCHALELISRGLVNVKPLITHSFSLDEWEEAFDLITNRKSEAVKVLFNIE